MTRTLLITALALATVPMSIATGCFDSRPVTEQQASAPTARHVEERFAIRFCYGQYRSQDDVTRCLAQAM
jgi:hypothetical protein